MRAAKRKKQQAATDAKRARYKAAGLRPRCPATCHCVCHEVGSNWHDHPGAPCPGKFPAAAASEEATHHLSLLEYGENQTFMQRHSAPPSAFTKDLDYFD